MKTKKIVASAILISSIFLMGCENLYTHDSHGRRHLSNTTKGAGIGAVGGALIGGSIAGSQGALIGAGAGGVAGGAVGRNMG